MSTVSPSTFSTVKRIAFLCIKLWVALRLDSKRWDGLYYSQGHGLDLSSPPRSLEPSQMRPSKGGCRAQQRPYFLSGNGTPILHCTWLAVGRHRATSQPHPTPSRELDSVLSSFYQISLVSTLFIFWMPVNQSLTQDLWNQYICTDCTVYLWASWWFFRYNYNFPFSGGILTPINGLRHLLRK